MINTNSSEFSTWQCIAWEGKHDFPANNYYSIATHRHHAEINLINKLLLKGIY